MILEIFNRIFKSTLYIRVSKNWISMRLVEKKREISDKPLVGINGMNKVVAVGEEANAYTNKGIQGYRVLNGFEHPRTIIGQFEIAETALRYFFSKVVHSRAFVRPIVVIHPKDHYEGGLSQIEVRALRDLGASAGGREVHIWVGSDLTDEELSKGLFPKYKGSVL